MRYNITNKRELEAAIMLLEDEVDAQQDLLTGHFKLLYESFRPSNILKDVLNEVATSEELRSNFITATIGISTGYILRKLFFKNSKNPVKGFFANLFQYGIANLLINPSRIVNSILVPFLKFFDKKEEKDKSATTEKPGPYAQHS